MTWATKQKLDAHFARMNAEQQDAFIARLNALAETLRQAHCDRVAAELLAELLVEVEL